MAEEPKTFDVSKPGKTSPDTSSKPLLVTNKPEVQDPMVAAGVKSASAPIKATVADKSDVTDGPARDEKQQSVTAGSMKPKIAPMTDQEKTDAGIAADPEKKAKSEEAVVDAVAQQAGDKDAKPKTNDAENAAKREAVQKLIDGKQYVVPIGLESGKKHSSNLWLAVVLIVLIAIGFYLALDAGIIKGINVPVHIIGN